MLRIDERTKYADIFDQLKSIYQNYISLSTDSCTEKTPLQYDFMTKVNTPLYYVDDLIDPKYRDDYRKSLLFIGKCHKEVPLNKKYMDTRDFNKFEINYAVKEFGYIPKTLKFKYKTLMDMTFSASAFRLMCVKAEIAIFLYFRALTLRDELRHRSDQTNLTVDSNVNDQTNSAIDSNVTSDVNDQINSDIDSQTNSEPISMDDIEYIFGAISCAVSRFNNFIALNEFKAMASYIWELTTFINVFANLDNEIEDRYMMPKHHVFVSTHRYGSIANFSDYNQYPCGDDFQFQLARVPKCPSYVKFDNDVLFYIPIISDTKNICTECFNEIYDDVKLCSYNLQFIAYELCKTCNYEFQFLLKKGEAYAEGCEFFFESELDAKKYIRKIEVPDYVNKRKLYFCLMIHEGENQYNLHIYPYY